jgi:hypothetical protein
MRRWGEKDIKTFTPSPLPAAGRLSPQLPNFFFIRRERSSGLHSSPGWKQWE